MGRKAKEVSALEITKSKKLRSPGMHAVGGVSGLYLQVLDSGHRSWILRAMVGGKRRDMGLGGYPDVPLQLAREKARDARLKIEQGIDPIAARREARSALQATSAAARTFKECATAFIDAKSAEWVNAKHRQQWTNTLETYAYPVIGTLLVRDVELPHIMRILEPIWTTKTETAKRVRGRVETVLDWATVRKFRQGDNPARWRGHLDKLLPAPTKVAKVEHHEAVPVDEMPALMHRIRAKGGQGAKALEFLILTATRSGAARGARWSEIDIEKAEWVVPVTRLKRKDKELRVPLSDAALNLIRRTPRVRDVDLVFPSATNRALSDMTLTKVLRDFGLNAVPHGFRSTFKDWASERTSYANEVSEMALHHAIGDKVEAAYRRGELFEKRKSLMQDWAAFCASPPPA